MIILEGPDGSGKSTLVDRLVKEFDLPLAPRACTSEGGPVTNLSGWTEMDLSHRLRLGKPSLHDRYPLISEMVYGPICRGRVAVHFDNPMWYSRQMAKLSRVAVVVWCLPSATRVRNNVQGGPKHMSGVAENIDKIYGGYVAMRAMWPRLMNLSPIECQVSWDYAEDDFDHLVKTLRNMEVGL